MNRSPLRKFFTVIALLMSAALPAQAQLLTLQEKETTGALAIDRSLTLNPSGSVLLAASFGDHALNSYLRDAGTGLLTFVESEIDGAGGVTALRMASEVRMSADGAHAYVISRQDDALVAFGVDGVTGALTPVEEVINGTLDPDSNLIIDGLWQGRGVAVSNDGAYVLGSGRSDPAQPRGAVALFTRDAGTGMLTFRSMIRNNDTPGLTALGNQGGRLFFSPDGAHCYVAATAGSAVIILTVDTINNVLVVAGQVIDGQNGVTGLGGASSIAFSSDGLHAYVTGITSNAVSHFTRNPGTGALTEVATYTDGAGGIDGLAGAAGVLVNPAGNRVYVSGTLDNAVAVFARAADGSLLYLGFAQDGVGTLDGLQGVIGLEMSADGDFLYTGAAGEAAIGVFGPGDGSGGPDAIDFGDAPDPTYPTLLASDGARHIITDGVLHLGAAMDAEADGQPDIAAAGDDSALTDDEDGVVFVDPLLPGQAADIDVTASAAGVLDAWIDWNNDGDWSDAGEQIASGAAMAAGVNTIATSVPVTTLPDSTILARFRLTSAGTTGPGGVAPDGEVEDYQTATGRAADLGIAPSGEVTVDWLDPYTLVQTVSNIGPNDITSGSVSILLSANSGPVTWTCVATGGVCTSAGIGDVADTVDLASGGTLVYTFSGVVPNEAPGPYIEAVGTVAPPVGTFDPVAANDSATARVKIYSMFLDGFETGDTSRWSSAVP